MDFALEQQIVALYINRGYRERILYELGNAEKRQRVMSRLCHQYNDIVKSHVMEPIVSSDATKIMSALLHYGGSKDNCYVLSLMWECDGIFLPMQHALDRVVGNGMAALVYCGNGTAYFEAEQVQGPPPRFLLRA